VTPRPTKLVKCQFQFKIFIVLLWAAARVSFGLWLRHWSALLLSALLCRRSIVGRSFDGSPVGVHTCQGLCRGTCMACYDSGINRMMLNSVPKCRDVGLHVRELLLLLFTVAYELKSIKYNYEHCTSESIHQFG